MKLIKIDNIIINNNVFTSARIIKTDECTGSKELFVNYKKDLYKKEKTSIWEDRYYIYIEYSIAGESNYTQTKLFKTYEDAKKVLDGMEVIEV